MSLSHDKHQRLLAELCERTAPRLLVGVLKGELLSAWEELDRIRSAGTPTRPDADLQATERSERRSDGGSQSAGTQRAALEDIERRIVDMIRYVSVKAGVAETTYGAMCHEARCILRNAHLDYDALSAVSSGPQMMHETPAAKACSLLLQWIAEGEGGMPNADTLADAVTFAKLAVKQAHAEQERIASHVSPRACLARSQPPMHIGPGAGEWYCGGCGANDKEPICKARKGCPDDLRQGERESVADVLELVESYGPWGTDINESFRNQIVLADEVKRLRGLLGEARPYLDLIGEPVMTLTKCDAESLAKRIDSNGSAVSARGESRG